MDKKYMLLIACCFTFIELQSAQKVKNLFDPDVLQPLKKRPVSSLAPQMPHADINVVPSNALQISREKEQAKAWQALHILEMSVTDVCAMSIPQIKALKKSENNHKCNDAQWEEAKQILIRPFFQSISIQSKENPKFFDAAVTLFNNVSAHEQMETTARKRIEITEAIDRREILHIKGIATIEARKRLELETELAITKTIEREGQSANCQKALNECVQAQTKTRIEEEEILRQQNFMQSAELSSSDQLEMNKVSDALDILGLPSYQALNMPMKKILALKPSKPLKQDDQSAWDDAKKVLKQPFFQNVHNRKTHETMARQSHYEKFNEEVLLDRTILIAEEELARQNIIVMKKNQYVERLTREHQHVMFQITLQDELKRSNYMWARYKAGTLRQHQK